MMIDFGALPVKTMQSFKGGEKYVEARIADDGAVKIMKLRLIPGAGIGMHTHETNSEIIYVLEGNGTAVCDGKAEHLTAGACHYCPKGHSHSLKNDSEGDLVFFAVIPEEGKNA